MMNDQLEGQREHMGVASGLSVGQESAVPSLVTRMEGVATFACLLASSEMLLDQLEH